MTCSLIQIPCYPPCRRKLCTTTCVSAAPTLKDNRFLLFLGRVTISSTLLKIIIRECIKCKNIKIYGNLHALIHLFSEAITNNFFFFFDYFQGIFVRLHAITYVEGC